MRVTHKVGDITITLPAESKADSDPLYAARSWDGVYVLQTNPEDVATNARTYPVGIIEGITRFELQGNGRYRLSSDRAIRRSYCL